MKKAVVLASSRGIGKSIADSLQTLDYEIVRTSKKELDTSNLEQVEKFAEKIKHTDILVFNTGGPASKDFFSITEKDWSHYHNQLFLSFCLMLQKIKINDGGYVFLISSSNIKEPVSNLILSNAYRVAFSSVLKSLSKYYAGHRVSCINIAPGPVNTDRLRSLVNNMDVFAATLPMKDICEPKEIGDFVKLIVENNIKHLTGVTINFDGGVSNSLF